MCIKPRNTLFEQASLCCIGRIVLSGAANLANMRLRKKVRECVKGLERHKRPTVAQTAR